MSKTGTIAPIKPTYSNCSLTVPFKPRLSLTKVMDFEEFWTVDHAAASSDAADAIANPLLVRTLAEGVQALERYRELTRVKLERNAKIRKEKLANMNEERARTLQQIEEDKALRRERAEVAATNRAANQV